MIKLTKTEEDYLKALFQIIVESDSDKAGTNQLADYLEVSPASAHTMLKKLKSKDLVAYKKYGKLGLTSLGRSIAIRLIRKHRLWETFLHKYMNFGWDEVHDVAEQLEHIKSTKLIQELDKFMGFPSSDPHGAIIPNAMGEYQSPEHISLSSLKKGDFCIVAAVKDSSDAILRKVTKIGLSLGSKIYIEEIQEFDDSMTIIIDGNEAVITKKFAEYIYIETMSVAEL